MALQFLAAAGNGIAGALAAAGIGAVGALALTKKEGSLIKYEGAQTYAQNIHQPFETYAPTTSRQYSYVSTPQYSYAVQIASPEARISTKKEDTISGTQQARQEPYIAPVSATSASAPSGLSNTTLIIAAVVIGAVILWKK